MKFSIQKISVKLLAFNILLLSLPMASLLYLDTYESQLLKSQESSMIQQGRMLAAALNGSEDLEADSKRILTALMKRVDSRIRIVDAEGTLLADSASDEILVKVENADESSFKIRTYDVSDDKSRTAAQDTLLYRTAVYPVNTLKKLIFPPSPDLGRGEYYSGKTILDGSEVKAALSGRYGAVTRFSSGGQRSINLYSALPVFNDKAQSQVYGAVLISRSTYQILSYLYELRLDIIRIFLVFLLLSVVLSFGLARSITIPVVKLKNEAGTILDSSGNFRNHFTGFKRGDEIGELSRSLTRLSSDLENKMEFIDRFTSDMLHELKNPLATIKAAAEIAEKTDVSKTSSDGVKFKGLIGQIISEEKRMERLLSEMKAISSLENLFENERKEDINLSEILPVILSRYQNIQFKDETDHDSRIRINIDRLVQAVVNPVDNAFSFTPKGKSVRVELSAEDCEYLINIYDEGSGIASGTEKEVFNRFYSDRPENERGAHSGLGLAIVQSIVSHYGGRCSIENRSSGGCLFRLVFPSCIE